MVDVKEGRAVLEVTDGDAGASVGPGDRVQIMHASQAQRAPSASAGGRETALAPPKTGGRA